jgi:hypothetical protein
MAITIRIPKNDTAKRGGPDKEYSLGRMKEFA